MPQLALIVLVAVAVLMLKHERNGWTTQDRSFWYALGTDQCLHGLIYLALVGVLIAHAV